MRPGSLDKYVSLSRVPVETPDSDGFFEDLSPKNVWASIQPLAPQENGRAITTLITMRYHAQVNLDSVVTYNGRNFFVRGVQNVNEQNVELRLLCEEVQP